MTKTVSIRMAQLFVEFLSFKRLSKILAEGDCPAKVRLWLEETRKALHRRAHALNRTTQFEPLSDHWWAAHGFDFSESYAIID